MNRSKESLKRELDTCKRNLDRLEERRANYGLNPPLDLLNTIDLERQAIARIEALLAERSVQAPPTELSEAVPAARSPDGTISVGDISGGEGIAIGEGAKATVAKGGSIVISESVTTTPPTPPTREEPKEAAPPPEKAMSLRVAIAGGGVVIFLAAVGLLATFSPVPSPQFVIFLLIVAAVVLGAMCILGSKQMTAILTGMTKDKMEEKAEDEGKEPS